MGRILLEGGIIFLLVLIGISIFIPSGNDVENVIIQFEENIENGESVEDGMMENVEIGVEDNANFIAKINCKIANAIVNGLNSVLELGMSFLREFIN